MIGIIFIQMVEVVSRTRPAGNDTNTSIKIEDFFAQRLRYRRSSRHVELAITTVATFIRPRRSSMKSRPHGYEPHNFKELLDCVHLFLVGRSDIQGKLEKWLEIANLQGTARNIAVTPNASGAKWQY